MAAQLWQRRLASPEAGWAGRVAPTGPLPHTDHPLQTFKGSGAAVPRGGVFLFFFFFFREKMLSVKNTFFFFFNLPSLVAGSVVSPAANLAPGGSPGSPGQPSLATMSCHALLTLSVTGPSFGATKLGSRTGTCNGMLPDCGLRGGGQDWPTVRCAWVAQSYPVRGPI